MGSNQMKCEGLNVAEETTAKVSDEEMKQSFNISIILFASKYSLAQGRTSDSHIFLRKRCQGWPILGHWVGPTTWKKDLKSFITSNSDAKTYLSFDVTEASIFLRIFR